MSKELNKTIGYFAIELPHNILCEGDACIVAATQSALNKYSKSLSSGVSFQNRKTSLREILDGISNGGAYAFDEGSYNLFYPLANKQGFNLKQENFPITETGYHFVTVKINQ